MLRGRFFFFEKSNICQIYTNIYLILAKLMEGQFYLDILMNLDVTQVIEEVSFMLQNNTWSFGLKLYVFNMLYLLRFKIANQ